MAQPTVNPRCDTTHTHTHTHTHTQTHRQKLFFFLCVMLPRFFRDLLVNLSCKCLPLHLLSISKINTRPSSGPVAFAATRAMVHENQCSQHMLFSSYYCSLSFPPALLASSFFRLISSSLLQVVRSLWASHAPVASQAAVPPRGAPWRGAAAAGAGVHCTRSPHAHLRACPPPRGPPGRRPSLPAVEKWNEKKKKAKSFLVGGAAQHTFWQRRCARRAGGRAAGGTPGAAAGHAHVPGGGGAWPTRQLVCAFM